MRLQQHILSNSLLTLDAFINTLFIDKGVKYE